VLVATASVLGLVDQGVYDEETQNWATQARGQDIGNLVAVLTLLLSGFGHHEGSHRAGRVWLGALLYMIYPRSTDGPGWDELIVAVAG
jgi:hypothetical protein